MDDIDLGDVEPSDLFERIFQADDDAETIGPEDHQPLLGRWRINWAEFWDKDHPGEAWLCEPLIAAERGHALYAGAKTGKSLLVLEACAAIATGRPFLHKKQTAPQPVLYIDYEMTEADLHSRLEQMGYGPEDDLSNLHYVLMPQIEALDTPEGGQAIRDYAAHVGAVLVVVDTTARAASGDENAMETIRDMYRYTLMPLKAAGIATLRLDHAGKDVAKGQRGTSAKNDDVDIVWQLTAAKENSATVKLEATHRRVGWEPLTQTYEIARDGDPDTGKPIHSIPPKPSRTWLHGTKELAARLHRAGIKAGTSQRAVWDWVNDGRRDLFPETRDELRHATDWLNEDPELYHEQPIQPVENPVDNPVDEGSARSTARPNHRADGAQDGAPRREHETPGQELGAVNGADRRAETPGLRRAAPPIGWRGAQPPPPAHPLEELF